METKPILRENMYQKKFFQDIRNIHKVTSVNEPVPIGQMEIFRPQLKMKFPINPFSQIC